VTVDVVILTLLAGRLHVLLVQRAADPYAGCWALPGGFKRPRETLDEAAARELREETGVEAAAHLSQLGAYGDPGRDPRTNVVTVAYIAVLRELQHVVAGGDAARAQLRPVDEAVRGRLELAFDHRRILEDALERTRRNLETTDLATAFVGPAFTLSELRGVFEAVWETTYDPGNFHRKLTGESGWLKATGERARPGPGGGKPSERYRAGRAWEKGAPFRRPRQRAASAR
jgi:8-oxo-dGTP diphosphatase